MTVEAFPDSVGIWIPAYRSPSSDLQAPAVLQLAQGTGRELP